MALAPRSTTAVYRLRHGTKLLRRIQTVLVAVAMPTSQQQKSIIIKLPPQQNYKQQQQQQQQIPPQPHPILHIRLLLHLPTIQHRRRRRHNYEIPRCTETCRVLEQYKQIQTKIQN